MYRALYCAFIALVLAVPGAAFANEHVTEYVLESGSQSVIGELRTTVVQEGEVLSDVALRVGVGYTEIVRANPDVLSFFVEAGTEVVVPKRFVLPDTPRRGIVINLPEYRLYYYPEPRAGEPQRVYTYPISIGRMDWETPLGLHRITEKRSNPTWYVPESVMADRAARGQPVPPVVPPGPDNPLGSRAMRLTLPSYLIHGTNEPRGVGLRVTAGCIRLYEDHVQELYEMVGVGTEVRIVNQPVKVGWDGDQLLVEAHVPLEEYAEEFALRGLTMLTEQVVSATREFEGDIDWRQAEAIVDQAMGIPLPVAVNVSERSEELRAQAD